MMISVVIFPAISQSRYLAQVSSCKNNLRQIGIALESYADQFAHHYPFGAVSGPAAIAGIYAPVLIESEFIADPATFVCPSNPSDAASMPRLSRVRDALEDVQLLSRLAPSLGGSYAYSLGFRDRGDYLAPSRKRLAGRAISGDRPNRAREGSVGKSNSPNHGGRGQNVLCAGGHVKFLTRPEECTGCDNLFISTRNRVEPGLNGGDVVLGVSEARVDMSEEQF